MKIYLGDKFYRHSEDESIQVLRVIKIKNTDLFVLEDEKTKERFKANTLALKEDYTKLKPDGFLCFTIAELQEGLKDVIVALYKRKDLEDGLNIPYAVCRQNIYDLHSSQIIREGYNENIQYIGMSMSKDTVPEGVNFEIILACNGISDKYDVSVYMNDKLEDILAMIKVKKFDIVLETLSNNMSSVNVVGSCKTLKDLLEQNKFMFDFHSAFNIHEITVPIETIGDTYELIPEQRIMLEDMLKVEMFKTYVLEYDKEINFSKIERDYVLVSDYYNKLYVIAYDKGAYINRYYQQVIKDKRDVMTMLKYKRK